MKKTGKTVFVGMSGGVDSSVAALRLKEQGFNVVGVFIKVWHPDFMVCNWEKERLDAMRVAAHLEIPFLTCDAEKEYKDGVADYFIREYKAGRTPNPDVMCNKEIKFGAFIRYAKERKADYIATGHYAQRVDKEQPELHRGKDLNKDQTYFLWTLTREQLAYSVFPVGNTEKDEIRKEAKSAKIPVAQKKDSQGICFLGHVDITEFLSHYIELIPGPVLNSKGESIGRHKGAFVYTRGQRHGFSIANQTTTQTPYYVTDKNIEQNTITVDVKQPVIKQHDSITLSHTLLRSDIGEHETLQAQFRYRQTPVSVTAKKEENSIQLHPQSTIEQTSSGQSCVLYRDSHCLGGGIIE